MIRLPLSTRGSRTINQTRTGPLPWLPGIPHRLAADPDWGPYLDARSHLVAQLADQVRINTAAEAPAWAAQPNALVPAELIADVQVWRAATQVDPSDLRPTGPPQLGRAARIFQQQLDIATRRDSNADRQWRRLLAREVPSATADPFLPELEERLSNLTRAGFDATHCSCGRRPPQDPYPTTTPPQPSGGASSTSYRKRRTRNPPPLRRSRRPGAPRRGHSTSTHPYRAWRRLARSARAAEKLAGDVLR